MQNSRNSTSGADPKAWFAPFCFAPAADEAALFASVARRFGRETAADLRRAMTRRDAGGSAAFYAALSPAVRTALALAYDGESLPKIAAFLADHRDLLAGRVLDAGCGCGLLTLAVDRIANPRELWAADRDAGALEAARAVCQAGGAAVRFAQNLPDAPFGAVLSARTLHENFDQSGVPRLETLPEAGRRLAARMAPYARRLTARVAERGVLISIERGEAGPVLLGWLEALAGCGFAPAVHESLTARECGRPADFQALILRRGSTDEAAALTYFCRLAAPPEPVSALTGTAADAYLHLWSGEQVCGFEAETPDGAPAGRAGVWRHRADGRVLLYQATPAGTALYVLPPAERAAAERQIKGSAQQAESAGYRLQKKLAAFRFRRQPPG